MSGTIAPREILLRAELPLFGRGDDIAALTGLLEVIVHRAASFAAGLFCDLADADDEDEDENEMMRSIARVAGTAYDDAVDRERGLELVAAPLVARRVPERRADVPAAHQGEGKRPGDPSRRRAPDRDDANDPLSSTGGAGGSASTGSGNGDRPGVNGSSGAENEAMDGCTLGRSNDQAWWPFALFAFVAAAINRARRARS